MSSIDKNLHHQINKMFELLGKALSDPNKLHKFDKCGNECSKILDFNAVKSKESIKKLLSELVEIDEVDVIKDQEKTKEHNCPECVDFDDCDCGFEDLDDVDDYNIECGVNCGCKENQCLELVENADELDELPLPRLINVKPLGREPETRVLIKIVNDGNSAVTWKFAKTLKEAENDTWTTVWSKKHGEWWEIDESFDKKSEVVKFFTSNLIMFDLQTIYHFIVTCFRTGSTKIKINYKSNGTGEGRLGHFIIKVENNNPDISLVDIKGEFDVDFNKSITEQSPEFYNFLHTSIKFYENFTKKEDVDL